MSTPKKRIVVGVLALQGAFSEHLQLLKEATKQLHASERMNKNLQWQFIEVKAPAQLETCDALILPGGESTTMSLIASRSGLLEPLRKFVKIDRKPVWGTCAGLILLAEAANRTKKGGQELIGGLDVRVNRNHFGRQTESFETELDLPFLELDKSAHEPFRAIFIRAPVVEKLLGYKNGEQTEELNLGDTIVAPARETENATLKDSIINGVKVLARLPRKDNEQQHLKEEYPNECEGDIIAVQQGNVIGTSFHPELTGDSRLHAWWLSLVVDAVDNRKAYPLR